MNDRGRWECFPVELDLEIWHFPYLPFRATDKLEYRRIRTTFENMNLPNAQVNPITSYTSTFHDRPTLQEAKLVNEL